MITYEGKDAHTVTRQQDDGPRRRLPLGSSLKLWGHSPTGFSWGYAGSGPSQLALALLLNATGSRPRAVKWHQPFKFAFVAFWQDGWRITDDEILGWLGRVEEAEAQDEAARDAAHS